MSEQPEHFKKRRVNLRFLYAMCNDVAAVRRFYSESIGLEELGHMDEEAFGWVGYDSEGMQLMFFRWDESLPRPSEWAWQPGDGAGTTPALSFSIEVPEEDSLDVLKRRGPMEALRHVTSR